MTLTTSRYNIEYRKRLAPIGPRIMSINDVVSYTVEHERYWEYNKITLATQSLSYDLWALPLAL